MKLKKKHIIIQSSILTVMLFTGATSYAFGWKGLTNTFYTRAGSDSVVLQYVFRNGENGYACFRIPAIVRTEKGTLLAFAEGRKNGCSDTGDIDLLLKRSFDGGKTWGPIQVVWDDGENTCGNPAPVVDRETGKIWLLATWNLGSDHEKEIIGSTCKDTRRVYVTSSADDGGTWRAAAEITKKVKRKEWTWYATGPCAGIQLTRSKFSGRLVIPCDHIVADSKVGYSHVIYSDNHGKTWKLGGIAQPQTNESTVTELSSGDVMLNMRNSNRESRYRQVAISHDGGGSWTTSYRDTVLVEPICQASLIPHRFSGDDKVYQVFSNPANRTKRNTMTIRISSDDAKTWQASMLVYAGPSAYSGLVSFPDGHIGILYEAGKQKPYEGIAFTEFATKDLANPTQQ